VALYTGPYCQYMVPGLDYGAVGVELVAGWGYPCQGRQYWRRIMEIKGKEYKKRLVDYKVKVTRFLKVKCSIHSDLTKRIWEKRKCFMCGGKFKDGDTPVVCITKKGLNKIICEECYSTLKE